MNKLDILTAESEKFKSEYSDILSEVSEYYAKTYGDKVQLSDMDVHAIGKYTQTVETYAPYMNEANDINSGLGNLGDALRDNLGLVATQYATSIIPLIASVQPTEQEIAIVYYKEAIATSSRGGVKKGDITLNKFGKTHKDLDRYMSDEQIDTSVEFVEANNGSGFTINLQGPVRPGTVNVNIEGKATAIDDGQGNIFGSYVDPTFSKVDYEAGTLKLKLQGHTGLSITDHTKINVIYTQLVFNSDTISGYKYQIKSEPVAVKYFPLQVTIDAVNNFVTKRQFGQAMSEFANKDLVYQINKAISGAMIKEYKKAALLNEVESGHSLTWSIKAPAGVSLGEHRATFRDIYEMAITGMEEFTGLGGISAVIVGSEGRQIYSSLGIGNASSKPGAYVLGFDGDIVVIYASKDYIDADEVLLIHKGDYFETAAIYAPFLPVMNIEVQGRADNVFQRTHGVATGAALKVVNRGFVQRVKLTK